MNNINLFIVFGIAAAASMFGAMVTPALAQDNMTMTMDDNMSMPMDEMTMTMDNSTG